MNKKEFSQYLRNFNFRELFNEMGWNNDKNSEPITVDNNTFTLQSVAQKSLFRILVCSPTSEGIIPDSKTRKKIETKARKLFAEHLIIFADAKKTEQIWQLVVSKTGKPTKTTETRYNINQDPELLFQRAAGIFFELDEEENITIVDVTKRITENFHQNAEKVVAGFYKEFSKNHKLFYEFVSGIDDHIDELNATQSKKTDNKNKQWYVSLMLNRLMFCYFIQKQRFLDNNQNYLSEKLKAHQKKYGKDKFYSFYKTFLMALFHEGLGAPDHDEELKSEIGKIPYLNGGLFDVHEIEEQFKEIEIEDKAFEKIFTFFDEWTWHLDTRNEAKGKDINPDVIGYIFEKYINDRAQMGAYYTKEDITDYISKNCILPFLFDETKRNYPKAFSADSEIWQMLKTSGDKYIYDAVKHGVNEELPAEIEIGVAVFAPEGATLNERRKDWNKSAPASYALPTEIWREVVDRRRRYTEVKAKIENGEIESINDFITYNLNITQFAEDVIFETTDPKFLEVFYKALNSVTIIDPTCGSGAFLFAAMNILESLYESCLQRMRNFTEDEDRRNRDNTESFAHKYQYFRDVLKNMQSEKHLNQQYFVYKNIILHNLHGVDIMKEAVEIAKLRLFLKLVATVEADQKKPNLGLEPLPDIDFNIRSGNTLIGYVSQDQIDNLAALLVSDDDKRKLLENCDVVARAFKRYKEIQLSNNYDYEDFKLAKHELNVRLNNLNKSLNKTLHKEHYGLTNYGQWKETHEPFHWFAEFYEIIHDKGGFDVVIGNPPYVEYKDVKDIYTVKDFQSLPSSDLYAFVMERALIVSRISSRIGLIIPMSCFTVDGFSSIQNLYFDNNNSIYISNWSGDAHPSKLFEGVDKRLHIILTNRSKTDNSVNCKTFVSKYFKWYSNEREILFDSKLGYLFLDRNAVPVFLNSMPKISSMVEDSILRKIKKHKQIAFFKSSENTKDIIYYTRKVSFFLQFLDSIPILKDSDGNLREPSELKTLCFPNSHDRNVVLLSLNSSVFYWYYIINSDCRNLNKREVVNFNVPVIDKVHENSLKLSVKKLMDDYNQNSSLKTVSYQNKGEITVQYFNFRLSKPIIDEIDKVLAEHYGFTEEELDFIINYDIKYRMGKELESSE